MERRKFLKTLPVLALAPQALALAQSTPKHDHSRHLITLGSAACQLAANYSYALSFDTFTYINWEKPDKLGVNETYIPFQTPEYLFEQVGHLRFPKSDHFPVLPLDQEIQIHLSRLTGDFVFLAGLGGVTATLLFQSVGSHYRNPSQRIEWLAMMPFVFEGIRRELRSQLAIRVLADQRREPTCLYLDEIRNRYGNLSIRSAYEKADEWVVS
jgi:hypothetical protein